MKRGRIVVRIEIATLLDGNGKLNHQKMDRLVMVLSNLQNSGKELLLVSSGAIVLGIEKLGLKINMQDYSSLMAAAAIGQAELIKLYQKYFDQFNQMIAQVLLTTDIVDNPKRRINTENTFRNLLERNIIPIINENDVVSTADIELDDNYPLARNVAIISKADIILIKSDVNSNYIIQPRNGMKAIMVKSEPELFSELDRLCVGFGKIPEKEYLFPNNIEELVF
ncbi:MAG: glutamate 5-kinase [Bacteroidales bacterium]|nr:glutamate 5-kinase [Bacteroidales bacterium]MBN2821403.1 glutamate 5-kinase [Bacteroidales bacterium]